MPVLGLIQMSIGVTGTDVETAHRIFPNYMLGIGIDYRSDVDVLPYEWEISCLSQG